MIVWHGYFAVPEAAKTGNQEIDEINLELAQVYTSVTRLLREKHNSAPFAAYLNIMEEDEDVARFKKCVSNARTVCCKLRHRVKILGGKPLNEPLEYWRKTFFYVDF
ncbi:hypothetical protein ACP70R_008008 [Stipagrostis hirtigluma subsp. patula]